MTLDEMNAAIQKRMNEIDAQKDELRVMCRARDRAASAARAVAAVSAMSPEDQKIVASSIASGEKFGTPGS